jgi:hypothetical protein
MKRKKSSLIYNYIVHSIKTGILYRYLIGKKKTVKCKKVTLNFIYTFYDQNLPKIKVLTITSISFNSYYFIK